MSDAASRLRWALWLIVLALLPSTPVRAQSTRSFDVFVNSAISGGKPGVYFVDARTGLSTVVVTNGTRHTLIEDGVLFQENETGAIKVAYPDGRIVLHTAMQPTGGAALTWVTSADRRRLAWSVSQRTNTSLLSDLYVAGSDGAEKKLALHTSSTRNIDTFPLAITDDGATVFYSRQVIAQKDYQLFPAFEDIFKLDVATGQTTQLPAGCACPVGISPDGRRFARLEPAADQKGFGVRIWDLAERLIRMSGFRPGADIEMVVVGLRPGEKLHEELWWDASNATPSGHPKIMLADVGGPPGGLRGLIPVIRDLVEKDDPILLHNLLEESVGLTNGHGMHGARVRHRPSGPTHSPSERAVGTP